MQRSRQGSLCSMDLLVDMIGVNIYIETNSDVAIFDVFFFFLFDTDIYNVYLSVDDF